MNNKKSEIQISVNTALQASITPIGIDFEMNRLRLGENYCCIFAITDYPSECDYGWLSKLTNIPGTIVSINSEPIDNGEAVNEISKKIRMYRGQAASTKDPRERQRCQKAADDQEKIMAKMDQNGEVMGKWNTTIMVLSRDKEDYNSRCDRVKNVASILGCKIRVLSNLQREGYQQISPSYPLIKRIQETSSRYFPVSTFVGGVPFSSGGFNDGKGFFLGKNSSGGLILLDLWKRGSSRTNSNITVVGGSGSGKSTAIKHIIASEYARGTKIIVIDPEGEYKDMCYNPLFEGDWIDVAGGKGGLIAIIVAAVIVVAIVVVLAVKFGPSMFNKYNRLGYVDVSGRTVAQVAEEQGMDVDEFLEQFDLPSDMPGNTTESAAYNCIPVSKMAEMYGMDFNTIKEVLKFPDDVDEDTAWGDAIGQVTLGDYVGEDNLAEFKETYGFGDDITADTLWKDVRQTVDEKSRQQRIESEKAEKESDKNKDTASAESTEAPAETESADATEAPNA